MALICRFIVSLLLLTVHAGGFAQGLITESAWLEDPSGQWTLEDVQGREFTPYSGLITKGYTPHALWIRLKVQGYQAPAEDAHPMPLVLRLRPSYLDDIRLYDSTTSNVHSAGDLHRKDAQEYQSLNHNFLLHAAQSPRTLWLRIKTTSSQFVNIELLPLKEAMNSDRRMEFMLAAYTALLGFLMAWSATHWLTLGDRLVGWFAILQGVYLANGLCIFGLPGLLLPAWLPASLPDKMTSVFVILAVMTSLAFHWQFLLAHQAGKKWSVAIQATLGFTVLLLAGYLAGYARTDLQANTLVVASAPMLFVFAALSSPIPWRKPLGAKANGHISKSVLVGTYLGSALTIVAQGMTLLGLVQSNFFVLYGIVAYSIGISILIFSLLQVRILGIKQLALQTQIDLTTSRQALEWERAQRDDQEQLFVMLAHEMKTPLATLQMWMNAGQLRQAPMERAIHDMNRLIERCVHASQITDLRLQPVWQTIQAPALSLEAIANCAFPDRVQFQENLPPHAIKADRQMLLIALSNLLENACKYSAPGSPIQVALAMESRDGRAGCLWTVRNEVGPAGVPDPEQVFVKYYRSPHARRQTGSGLGLFLVKGLSALLKGHIGFET